MRGSGQGKGSGPAGRAVRYSKGGYARLVRTSGARWSEAAEKVFLDVLAASCNVKMAADASGFSTRAIYKRRMKCAAFHRRFEAAREQGFARLEMELIRTAADSMEGIEFDADRPLPKMTVDDAIRLLKAHKRQVAGEWRRHPGGVRERRKSIEEMRVSILRKVEAIKRARELPEHPAGEGWSDWGHL